MIYYTSGKIIEACTNKKKSLKGPGRNQQCSEQYFLDEELVKNDSSFEELLRLWIRPCMDRDNGTYPSGRLFRKGADPEAQSAFLSDLINLVTRDLWPRCPHEEILSAVDKLITAASTEIHLRVKVICIFLGRMPNQVFSHKENWYTEFVPNQSDAEVLEIRDGDAFEVCLDGVKKLTPRLLHNPTDTLCTIRICYDGSEYFIRIPPHGALRALFGDSNCKRLLCVKGRISVNPLTEHNAFVQLITDGKPSLYTVHNQYRHIYPYDGLGVFRDAAVDGKGGAIVIKDNGVYYTANGELKAGPELPIRVYGAGPFWALQYEDGRIESNLRKHNTKLTDAWALVENGNQSILFFDAEGAWECSGLKAKSISREEFVKKMLSRFEVPDCCEAIEANSMRICVLSSGELEVC